MGSLARGTPRFIAVPPTLLALALVTMASGTVPMAWWSLAVVGVLGLGSLMGVYFFRDPERHPGEGLLAPAHGRVLGVTEEGDLTRVSTFMGPLDVHVVRAPLGGRVVSMERDGRGYHRAYRPEARHNVSLDLDLDGGEGSFHVVMISGWFARRIVPYVEVGEQVARGARIGLIRFGSRVDVLVPGHAFDITVVPGQRVRAGSGSLGVMADAHR